MEIRSMAKPPQEEVTIVTACRNREVNLRRAIVGWLRANPREIIICDWGSRLPLTHSRLGIAGEDVNRVTIIRVEEADRWILTWAFNEALSRVTTQFTIKLDCDHAISDDFFEKNVFKRGHFSRGHWRNAEPGQEYINGAFISCSELLRRVGFYDERIVSYGWDDSDIYARLYDECSESSLIADQTVTHLDQDEEQRTEEQDTSKEAVLAKALKIKKTDFMIMRNRILSGMLWPWNPAMYKDRLSIREDFAMPKPRQAALIEYANIKAYETYSSWGGNYQKETIIDSYHNTLFINGYNRDLYKPSRILLSHVLDRYAMAHMEGDDIGLNIIRLALLASGGDDLSDRRLATLAKIEGLLSAKGIEQEPIDMSDGEKLSVPTIIEKKERVFADLQHGLGNRLRALASAASIANSTNRELVIVWQQDDHCQARLKELFEYHGDVLEKSLIGTSELEGMMLYNYMSNEPGGNKGEEIDLSARGDIYIRSAFVLNAKCSNWDIENRFLKRLRPAEEVREIINSVRSPNDLSVHIRMAGGPKYEHLPYESADNWSKEDHLAIANARSKSHYSAFMRRIKQLIREDRCKSIFVASDTPEVYRIMENEYGDMVSFLARQVNDRSAEQLKYALADAILLSRAQLFLGSTWSSFSELAIRLAPAKLKIEISGEDF